jgi:hypothetical protein
VRRARPSAGFGRDRSDLAQRRTGVEYRAAIELDAMAALVMICSVLI